MEPNSHSAESADGPKSVEYTGPFAVDTHVHFHPGFQLGRFMDAASRNFRRYGVGPSAGDDLSGVLVLTEGAKERNFARLRDGTLTDSSNRWSFEPCGDEIAVIASARGEGRVLIVVGRQIVARERLEVLLLGSAIELPDGRPFRDVLTEAAGDSGIAAVPWGFGKWWMERGKVVREGLQSVEPGRVFVADNGGRPRSLPRPALMSWAMGRGHGLLAGSDPLPLSWQADRAGRYGSVVFGSLPEEGPGRALIELIRSGPRAPRLFGVRDSWLGFVRAQAGIRLSP